jgi:peptidyl-prolyl cis-trans isomerase B (cyclophilin B)
MARANDPDSASCQFFIVHETSANNTASLDGKYAAFGRVTSGIEIVDKVCGDAEPIDNNGSIAKAAQPVIKTITIQEK